MLGLWLAIIATAPPPELADVALPEGEEVMLTAERLLHDGKKELTTAEGRAKLTSAGIAVDADRIVYDQPRNVVTAVGHVVARVVRGGKVAITSDVLTMVLDEHRQVRDLYVYDGRAVSKKDVSDAAFLAAATAEALEKTGTTQTILEGNHLQREPNGWRVEALELVPCECDFAHPSWSITSSSAVVDTEHDRVSITNPVVRVKNVPILWLPWLSLPMTSRQTGMLFPKPGYSSLNGFSLDAPVFITAGRSYDFTLTPGFFTGAPLVNGVQSATGVQGPRLNTEFRYAPAIGVSGKAVLGLLYDFRTQRAVDLGIATRGNTRGLRGEFSWLHVQDFGLGFGARVDVSAHSDGDYNRDLTVDVIASATTYLRSSAKVFQKGDTHYVGVDVGLRQDIQWGYDWLGRQHLTADTTVAKYGPGTLQRLPALTFGWQPERQAGPVRFELEGDVVRLSPLFSNTGDEGVNANGGAITPVTFATAVNAFYAPRNGVTGVGDRVWQPGEREARLRLMAKPTVSYSVQPFGVMSATVSASWRQYLWAGEASKSLWHRGYLLLDAKVETELSRKFGAFRHVIQPLIEVRALPFGVQSAQALTPYDAVDAAVPNLTARVQGVAELRQRLLKSGTEIARLSVGQGVEFSGPTMQVTPGEFYAALAVRFGWFSAAGQLRFDPDAKRVASDLVSAVQPGRFTRGAARVEIDDGRGHGIYAGYDRVLLEGTMRSRQPLDLLFLVDRGYTSATPVQMITSGVKWNFGPVFAHYDVLISDQQPLIGTGATAVPDYTAAPRLTFQQHALGVGFAPACDCWRVDFTATQPLYPRPVVPLFALNVTVARFGSIGVSSPR